MVKSFKEQHTLDERINESCRIKARYPDRVPVIIECSGELDSLITKKKYLVPRDISISSLSCVLRNRSSKIDSRKAIILFIDNKMPKAINLVGEIYDEYIQNHMNKKERCDEFLYVYVTYESTFG